MTADVRQVLDRAPMGRLQIAAIVLCVLLNALDGFDVLAISFASPGIATEWGIDRAALGIVLSMELIGMAAGSIVLGALADRIGRKPTTLVCLSLMTVGMAAASLADTVTELSLYRLFTGLGIGGMLACTNAMVAEFANARARSLAVAVMAAGYPMGAIVGGSFASQLLISGGWRDIFSFGAVMTAVFLPVTLLLLPESVDFLVHKRPANALSRINAILRRMGHAPVETLPEMDRATPKGSFRQLFGPGLASTTAFLTIAYFSHIMTFYFILKWIPKIVVDMGYAASSAGGVLVWANVGGLTGALLLSALSWRFPVHKLVIGAMLLSFVTVTIFGRGQSDIATLAMVAAAAGFFTNAGVVGLYALIAEAFPTAVRGSGTGFVIGFGRGGAAAGPVLAGFLFSIDLGLATVALAMACGSLIAAGTLLCVLKPARRSDQAQARDNMIG